MFLLIVVCTLLTAFWLWAREETIKNRGTQPAPKTTTQYSSTRKHTTNQQAYSQPRPSPKRVPVPIPNHAQRPQAKASAIPPGLIAKLNGYTYNPETSYRLVCQVAEKNPGKSPQWCAEKALWDLERDRY